MASPSYSDLGKQAKDLLYGGKTGAFQFDKKLNISTKTAEGVNFSLNGVLKGNDVVSGDLKGSYKASNGVSIDTILRSDTKANISVSYPNVIKDLSATVSATLPNLQSSGKLGLDYKLPNLSLKAGIGLTQQPLVDLALAAGNPQYVVGGDLGFDTGSQQIKKWSAGVGYFGKDFQASTHLQDFAKVVKVAYAHKFNILHQVGAEFSYNLESKNTGLVLAYATILQSGAITKFKIDDKGLISLVYQQNLDKTSKLALAGQFDAQNSKPAKFGVSLEVTN